MSEQNPQYPPAGPPSGPPQYGATPQYPPPPQYPAPPQAQPYPPPPPAQPYPPPGQAPYGAPPGAFDAGPPPAPKKSRKGLWITLSVVVLVLIVGGVVAVIVALPFLTEGNAHLNKPQTIAGMTLSTQPELVNAADQMKNEISRDVTNSTGSLGAFYSDPSDETKIVMVAGVTGRVADPGKELDDAFTGMSSTGLPVSGIHTVDPGSLGGEAKCGSGETSGQKLVVCAWADHGSLGMIVFFNREAAASETLFRQFRDAILTRG